MALKKIHVRQKVKTKTVRKPLYKIYCNRKIKTKLLLFVFDVFAARCDW